MQTVLLPLKCGVCEGKEERLQVGHSHGQLHSSEMAQSNPVLMVCRYSSTRLLPSALPWPCAVPSDLLAAVPGARPAPSEPNKPTLVTMVAVTTADATPAPAVTKAFLWALKPPSRLLLLFHFSLAGAHLFCFGNVSHRLNENL